MTTYYGLYGQKVQYLASDPTDPQTGQVWYNSTSAVLKVRSLTTSGTWASGGNLNTGRSISQGAGTQTAGILCGGFTGAPSSATEQYNGTSWTAVASMNTARYDGGASGTQTATLAFGGSNPINNATESYNGTSWTTLPATMNNGRYGFGFTAAGPSTAALAFGGTTSGTSALDDSESYNGSTWTSTPVLATAIMYGVGFGTPSSAILTSGGPTHVSQSSALTQSWNGSSWTNLPAGHNLTQAGPSRSGFGTASSALIVGVPAPSVELYNGTSWTAVTAMPGSRDSSTGIGASGSLGLVTGTYAAGTSTIEWTGPGTAQTQTVTVT
jgi:hypothetical protein